MSNTFADLGVSRPVADALRSRGIDVGALSRVPGALGSLPRARHSETGTGLTRPPSSIQRSSNFTGENTPGSAQEARAAVRIGPRVIQISRPVFISVHTLT